MRRQCEELRRRAGGRLAGAVVLGLLCLGTGSALAGSSPSSDPRWHPPCESEWLDQEKPNPKMTAVCVDHWLIHAYRPGWTGEDLILDPMPDEGPEAVSYRDLERTEAKLAPQCSWEAPPRDPGYEVARCTRVREALAQMLRARLDLDEWSGGIPVSYEPLVKTLLAGEPLAAGSLRPQALGGSWSKATLRVLRNACFARHRRPFRSADLTEFFYGPLSSARFGFTLKPDPDYSDARLSGIDRANVTAIQEAERRATR